MRITEVRVKMVGEESERLRAFCSVTIDDAFVIRDLKIIDGDDGPFVAMPSRKMSDHCGKCGEKNHLRAKFCNECGTRLNPNRAPRDAGGRVKLYADVAHPINVEAREMIQEAVIQAFNEELSLSLEPGYDRDDDAYEDYEVESEGFDDLIAELRKPKSDRRVDDSAEESSTSRGKRADRARMPKDAVGDEDRTRHQRSVPEKPRIEDVPPRQEPRRSAPLRGDVTDPSAEPATERVDRPMGFEVDEDDFCAGLDWSSEVAAPADAEATHDAGKRNGRRSRNRRPDRQRESDAWSGDLSESAQDQDADDIRVSESASVASPDGNDDDDFGVGIL